MNEFFRGWRRKIGVVTLLMTCLLMGGWVRSQAKKDRLGFDGLFAISEAGKLTVIRDNSHIPSGRRFRWGSRTADERQNPLIGRSFEKDDDYWTAHIVYWRMDFAGFHFGAGRRRSWNEKRKVELCVMPYSSIVVPMTLLSGLLLLSKSGKSAPKKLGEPISVTGE